MMHLPTISHGVEGGELLKTREGTPVCPGLWPSEVGLTISI